ncbi:hypothetical protein SGFS_060160 [Streptomyces graminofaciens]|uniref:Uncharacterized protein n=1 Tax=Streptomyces graminofaciens TaxID=68212 RepID=A0ABN5VMM9_9ACTN|nr:hypothetical protein SGFS_060160 [Streptomyces graminofaciens]
MDNSSDVDAGMTDLPVPANLFAPCPTCGNAGDRQGAQLFPHPMHKIRHGLWTTVRERLHRGSAKGFSSAELGGRLR